jgi:signal transduction histidine kinase/ActR/RegA family two-component response regulator
MNSGLAVQKIIEHTLAETHKSFPFLRISFWTGNASGMITAMHSVRSSQLPANNGYEVDFSKAEEFLEHVRKGESVVVADVNSDRRTQNVRDAFSQAGTRAILLIPVQSPQHEIAFVSYGAAEVRQWTEDELAILSDMAEYLALAIRQAHSQEERLKIEEHLRESQKIEAVGRLVGGIAHDFNNLLTAIMIYTGLLSSALGKEHRLYGHVDEIRQAGERGANLVAQLLALTKQQVLEPKVVSIGSVVEGIRDMLQRVIGEDIVLLTNAADDLKTARLDIAQLEQVILNMAINARDAMPSGGRLVLESTNIRLSSKDAAAQELPPGDYVQLRVSDTGHGMNAETAQRIFEPFFTTKGQGKGTGLGLATAYGIIRQHGGNISVWSEEGKGTTFRVLLPATPLDAAQLDSDSDAVVKEESSPGLETILLVEDEAMVRRSIVQILRLSGYKVLEAPGGPEALELSDSFKGHIPLMVTDLVMPVMNGRQVADRMAERRPDTAVLFISGYTDDPRTRRMLGEGADFFRKPFSPGALIEKVREVLDRNGRKEPSAAGARSFHAGERRK